MNIVVQHREPQAAEWRQWALTRAQFVLRRMRDWVISAQLRLSDTNGPRGGLDKRCTVTLHTAQHGELVVSATGAHWGAAINAALRKVARQLSRLNHRSATQPRLALAHARIVH